MLIRTLMVFVLLHGALLSGQAAAALQPGDIVIIGLGSDGDDRFAWVPLVDLSPGQTLFFTDGGWNGPAGKFQRQINAATNPATTSPSGGAIRYTVPPGGLKAGTVVSVRINAHTEGEPGSYTLTVTGASATDFSGANDTDVVGDQGVSIATTGDKLFVLSGSLTQPTFLYGVNLGANQWNHNSTTTQYATNLPPGLTNGLTAVAIGVGPVGGDEIDNGRYVGPTAGVRTSLLAAIGNVANWERSDDEIADLTNGTTVFILHPPPLATVALDTVFVAHGDTAWLPLTLTVTPGQILQSVRLQFALDQPEYARFPMQAIRDTRSGLVVTAVPNGVRDTLSIVIQSATGLSVTSGESCLLGRIGVVPTGGILGVETILRVVNDTSFSVYDETGNALDRTGKTGMVQIGLRGDTNLDGNLNVLDIILFINRLLKGTLPEASTILFAVADANEDNSLDISDVVRVVNQILRIPTAKQVSSRLMAETPARVFWGKETLTPEGRLSLPLYIASQASVAGFDAVFQFDPTRLSVGAPSLVNSMGDALFDYILTNGQVRAIAARLSETPSPLTGTFPIVSLPILNARNAEEPVSLASIKLVDKYGFPIPIVIDESKGFVRKKRADPLSFTLADNVPNPFNPSTVIRYVVAHLSHVRLKIYNLLGQEVIALVDEVKMPGQYQAVWDGRNTQRQRIASGTYLYRMTSDTGFVATKRLILLK